MASQRNVVELVLQLKDELSKNAGKMSKSMLRLQKGFQVLAKASLAAGAAIAAFGASLFAIAKSTAAFADELGKAAQATGITVEALSGLKFAADLGGISFEELQTALIRFSQVAQKEGKTTEQALRDLADRFAKMPDGAEKTAEAMLKLGRAGARMIPMLNGGAIALDEAAEEAKKLGIAIDQKAADAAARFNDTILRLSEQVKGLKIRLGTDLIPVIQNLLTAFQSVTQSQAFKDFMGFLKSAALTLAGDRLHLVERRIKAIGEAIKDLEAQRVSAAISGIAGPGGLETERIDRQIEALKAEERALKSRVDILRAEQKLGTVGTVESPPRHCRE